MLAAITTPKVVSNKKNKKMVLLFEKSIVQLLCKQVQRLNKD